MSLTNLRSCLEEHEKVLAHLQDKVTQLAELLGGQFPTVAPKGDSTKPSGGMLGDLLRIQLETQTRATELHNQIDHLKQLLGFSDSLQGNLAQAIAEDLKKGTFRGGRLIGKTDDWESRKDAERQAGNANR